MVCIVLSATLRTSIFRDYERLVLNVVNRCYNLIGTNGVNRTLIYRWDQKRTTDSCQNRER